MLVGAYPFEDPEEPKNFRKTIHVTSHPLIYNALRLAILLLIFFFVQRILNVQYSIPDYVHISAECRHLISRIFVADPAKVVTVSILWVLTEFTLAAGGKFLFMFCFLKDRLLLCLLFIFYLFYILSFIFRAFILGRLFAYFLVFV